MWDLIINPTVTLMYSIYMVTHDVVVAIAVVTIVIRLITYPLTLQQQRSARATQELQPKMKRLQEKYKNDREKLSQEQMKLYQENGINPLGGCLPIFIQLPILLALYQAIQYAFPSTPTQLLDLSGRLLIPSLDRLVPLNNIWLGMDLTMNPMPLLGSAPGNTNPWWSLLLPLLVLVTTWLQFKVTTMQQPKRDPNQPADATDQAQAMTQSMGTIMPIMYGYIALNFSVGISIYFVVSNIIGIIQYRLMPKAKPASLTLEDLEDEESVKETPKRGSTKNGQVKSGTSITIKPKRKKTRTK